MEFIISIWILIVCIFFGIRFLILKKNWVIENRTARLLGILHLIPLILYIACIVLSFYHLSFRGYRSSSIIFILTILSGVPFFLFRRKTYLPAFMNYLLTFACCFTVPAMVFWIYITFSAYKKDVYYEDDTYRLQDTFGGIMAARTFPDLFIKQGLLEKRYFIAEPHIYDINSVEIKKEHTDSICITVHRSSDTSEDHSMSRYKRSRDDLPNPYIFRIKE